MSWKEIINKEQFPWHVNTRNLKEITPYGLHSCIFSLKEEEYNSFLEYLDKHLSIKDGESVAEFGCGNGSNLLHFRQRYNSEVYGIDISKHLIDQCRELFPCSVFQVGQGPEIPLPDKSVDHFISNSVFQYFPSKEFADSVIKEMCRVARKTVMISDLKNVMFEKHFKEEQACRQGITVEELKIKYKDTPHLFFMPFDFDTVVYMPQDYPDSKFGSFSIVIKLDKS